MNLSMIVGCLIVLLFIWQGYKKGFIFSLIRYFSYLIACLTSMLLFNKPSQIFFKYFPNFPIDVFIMEVSFCLFFFTVGFVVNFVACKLLRIALKENIDIPFPSKISKISGAVIGMIAGCCVGLLVYVLIVE